jgi:glycine/D-amino acid oxidase-like deaminating enzyme/nitrite reductase/ring-hydroxylating ferredoxin subunit
MTPPAVDAGMNSIAQRTRSLWMPELAAASGGDAADVETDIVVVGAGLGGVTTAYLLAREGRRVVVLDAGPPGGGMTGRTTAHLTAALDDRWHDLISIRGEAEARVAADAHRGAIDLVEEIQDRERIACDFARLDGRLVPASPDSVDELARELEAAHRVGLGDVVLEPEGLRFPRQGRFHPLKYLNGLKACIERDGGSFFTAHVRSLDDGAPVTVHTDEGPCVRAMAAVVATNTPINDRVAIHTKLAPYRTYVVAGRVAKGSVPDELLWDTGFPYHYVRLQPLDDGSDVLIVGGEDHKSGQAHDMDARLQRLEAWARHGYPSLGRIEWRWSGQVMESVDDLAYLGRNPGNDNVYVITGDSGMGMTHTTIGARIVAGLIQRRPEPWADLFAPNRVSLKAAGTYAGENLNVAARMADHVAPGEVDSVDEIRPDSGAIVRRGLHKIAAWRSPDGTLLERSAVCPHIGCVVAWNPLEACWDCPCHGSQFAADGRVINGPATVDLSPVDAEHPAAAAPRSPRRRGHSAE